MTADIDVLHTLQARFEQHMHRHPRLTWPAVRGRIEANPKALDSLRLMEASGGEPDAVVLNADDDPLGPVCLCDCAPQSPSGRRSLCYDGAALAERKAHPPAGSALDLAQAMGTQLLTPEQYRALQRLDAFDTKTSSWLLTPPDMRAQGGALFGDRRYGQVFTYHNGASSYYAVRGFRSLLWV
ncbi:hypothetical protein CCO03_14155 [Comamonas serinivorans]|uniref:DUF4256 domain-containing protein n=1 Tax=Comamonas serinivorans TaxID=1082851 RepID=A0A1Y0EPU7_9BURK|nr:DUF4256 domain-containing protein [Comamonas serinivorans]ARU05675.1 hypothetical protein CCO03_14155 [Comamonas serinivorans]